MIKRRRMLRERKIKRGIKDLAALECRIYAYYLYVICKFRHDNYPDDEGESDFLAFSYTIFKRLAARLRVERLVTDYLCKLILSYEEHGILTSCNSGEDKSMYFRRSKIPYSYREDSDVEDLLRRGQENLGLLEVNLYRCFFCLAVQRDFPCPNRELSDLQNAQGRAVASA